MNDPVTFPVSAGLLEAKHVNHMPGQSVFVFLWLINRVTSDADSGNGHYNGAVLGGQPVNLNRIAEELGMTLRTVRRYVAILIKYGYLTSQKTGSGACIYAIMKSKKWCWQRNGHTKPAKGESAEVDPRHAPARDLIQQLFAKHFSVACPWNGSEASALKKLLQDNPSWKAEQLALMIRNRFNSDSVTADRPRLWLGNLAKYALAPLDKYQKPKAASVRLPIGSAAENYRKLLV
jgi:hypothetical protein